MLTQETENKLRRVFWYVNRYFMVPMFRLGLGPWIGTPFGGYMMVLKIIGRKTGNVRYTPVNYAIEDGDVYCVAGFGAISDWYRNVRAHPNIEAILPSGAIAGIAEEVSDPALHQRLVRQIFINAGFAGFFYGYDPRTVSDEQLRETTADLPVIRIRPTGIGSGASDPGGWAWLTTIGSLLFLIALFKRGKKRT